MIESTKQAAKNWASMSEADKEPYYSEHKVDRKRYDKAMDEYSENGYFTLSDGTKSYTIKKKN